MLNSRTARIVIALLAAVLIWGYVVGEVNPAKTKTIRNVPITHTYDETLNERGLAVANIEDEYINVEVSGARAILGDISPADISATVNVASAQKGENDLSISIRVPSGITVNKQSEARTKVVVENLTQKIVNVDIEYTGVFAEGDQAQTVNTSASQVIASGAESLVQNVVSARGVIDSSSVGETVTALPCQLEPVDKDGNPVQGVSLSQRNISVTTVIAREKTVDLIVPITDNGSESCVRSTVAPETITLFGNADVLEKMQSLSANMIDISEIEKTTDIKLEFTLPTGVEIVEGKSLVLNVAVDPIEEKSIEYTSQDITISGGKNGFDYSIAEDLNLQVVVRAKKTVLDKLNKSNVKLSLDVSKLEGSSDVVIDVSADGDVVSLAATPSSLWVTMEEAAQSDTAGN